MNVSLDEHRLGELRWIVLRGPDREAFQALGEHMRDVIADLTAGEAVIVSADLQDGWTLHRCR